MHKRFFILPVTLALSAGLLIGSMRSAVASELMPTQVSAPQSPDAGQSDPGAAPMQATPTRYSLPPLGAAGFGWG